MIGDKNCRRILKMLYDEFQAQGPSVTIWLGMFEQQLGIDKEEVDRCISRMARQGLVRYWELGDAISLSSEGMEACQHCFSSLT